MTLFQIGILGCFLLCVFLLTSMPVAFVMAIVGYIGFAIVRTPEAAMSLITLDFYDTFSNYSLIVIPLFVLMGQVSFHSGISRNLFYAAYQGVGALPGGLAMATVGACTAFGAICGSGPATAATMASVALPEMKRYNYSDELSCGTVASGGTLAMLIPPSIVFIVYGILTEQSIGKLFISGIMPGLMVSFMFCVMIYFICKRNPTLGPSGPSTTWMEKFASLKGVFDTGLMFILVIGGMFLGVFTATEAAAAGAAGSIAISVCRRKLSWKMFIQSLMETIRTSCMIMIIVAGAIVFGHFLAVTQLPSSLASLLAGLPSPGWVIITFIMIFYLIAGCFVDALALVFLTVPIFYPVVQQLHYDPIWFGVMIVLVTQMGVITPPVGVCVYVVSGIARDVPMQTIFKGSMPFLYILIIATAIIMFFPKIALFLPNLVN